MWRTNLAAATAVAATLLTGGVMAGAATPEYLAPLEDGGVQIFGRTRNESCSVTTTIKSVDGQAHTVSVNQTPKWGPASFTVPAGGQVTVVVNGDLVDPYTVTVDGAVVIGRPVPRVTPGGVDCGATPTTVPEPPSTTTVSVTTPAPGPELPDPELPLVPQSAPPVLAPPSGGSTTTTPPVEVDPPTTSTTVVPMLPETGTSTLVTVLIAAAFGILGAALIVFAGWLKDRNKGSDQ